MRTNTPFRISVKNGITKDPYPGTTSRNPTYSGLRVGGIQSIANFCLLSDERHILFYSQTKGEERELSIVDHSTLECRTFTSGELSIAEWPQSGWDQLAAWHSGSVLLSDYDYRLGRGEKTAVLKSFDIDLDKLSLCKGSDIKIPGDLQCFGISAISMDQNYTYVALDSKPQRILVVFERNDNSLVARLAVPEPADPGEYDCNQISGIVIRKDCIAATTLRGHIAIWDRRVLVGTKNDVDIRPDWTSTKVDSLELGLEHMIDDILMSRDCERMVVLDQLWYHDTAYISRTPEKVQTIPARKHRRSGDSFLRVDGECRIAAVGVVPAGVRNAATPQLKLYDANEANLRMIFPGLKRGLELEECLGEFRDFSLEQSSIKFYGTKGIVSVDFGEGGPMPDDIYRCSRNIPLNLIYWGGLSSQH